MGPQNLHATWALGEGYSHFSDINHSCDGSLDACDCKMYFEFNHVNDQASYIIIDEWGFASFDWCENNDIANYLT